MNDEKDLRPQTKTSARRVTRLYSAPPKSNTLAQLHGKPASRAGTSVGANYRKASRARSKAGFNCKLGDCLKAADEALYWLGLLLEEKFVAPNRRQPLLNEVERLPPIPTAMSKRSTGVE